MDSNLDGELKAEELGGMIERNLPWSKVAFSSYATTIHFED